MKLIRHFLTKNPCYAANLRRADRRYTDFQTLGPRGLMLHSVGCAQPSARRFAEKWDSEACTGACVHAFIDADTGEILQTLPWHFRGWHGGGSCNDTHIGVELCEPDCLVYIGSGRFTVTDLPKAAAAAARTYTAAVELFARLCEIYCLNPMTDILSHAEGHAKGIATNHGDPEHLWRGLGLAYTMDGFRRAVAARMKEEPMTKEEICDLVEQRLTEALGPRIQRIGDVPHASVRREVRTLLDCGAIDGGTREDPDDIRLPYSLVRTVVMAKRYADHLLGEKIP